MEASYVKALLGGLLIGSAATLLLATLGRVMGVSGIVGRLPFVSDRDWRLAFLGGMTAAGIAYIFFFPSPFLSIPKHPALLVLAGLLVGYGTRYGNGCTSGHGVCGISRFSLRSILATVTFIGAGILTVFVLKGVSG